MERSEDQELFRKLRSEIRIRALGAIALQGKPFEVAEAESLLETAAGRFIEGDRQLDDPEMRCFYATLWEEPDLIEDKFVELVLTHLPEDYFTKNR